MTSIEWITQNDECGECFICGIYPKNIFKIIHNNTILYLCWNHKVLIQQARAK